MTGTLAEAANKASPRAGLVIPPAAWPARARAVIEPPKASVARVPGNRKPNLKCHRPTGMRRGQLCATSSHQISVDAYKL